MDTNKTEQKKYLNGALGRDVPYVDEAAATNWPPIFFIQTRSPNLAETLW